MKLQEHWYLSLLGLVGLYKFPTIWDYFQGTGAIWDLLNLLWFGWFLYLLPESDDNREG